MRAFVTGAGGFLGKSLVGQLLAEGIAVRCLVRTPAKGTALQQAVDPLNQSGLEIVIGSLGRADSLTPSLADVDIVFHLAAAMRGATAVLFLNNVVATRDLLAACGLAGVKRFVLVSSIAVYGTGDLHAGTTVDESCALDSQPHRRDAYAYSKVAEEDAARHAAAAAGVPLTIIRPGVIYGPGRNCLSSRIGLQLGKVMLRMGGGQRLPYTYVDNCARAIALAGTVPGAAGEAFSIVDDNPPTSRSLLRQYHRAVKPIRVLPIPQWAILPLSRACQWYHEKSHGQLPAVLTPYKSNAMWKPLIYCNSKAKRLLGWKPEVDFAEGLHRTFESLRAERERSAA